MDPLKIYDTNIVRLSLVRHVKMMDVAIRVLNPPSMPCKRILIEGFWYNLAFEKTFNIGETPLGTSHRHLMLTLEKLSEWEVYAGEDILNEPMFGTMSKYYRNVKWEPVWAENMMAKKMILKA